MSNGSLKFGSVTVPYGAVKNVNKRTIQGFATDTDKHRVNGSGEFYYDFDLFQEYYGTTDYADKWIMAALSSTNAQLTRGNGNFNGISAEARVGKFSC